MTPHGDEVGGGGADILAIDSSLIGGGPSLDIVNFVTRLFLLMALNKSPKPFRNCFA